MQEHASRDARACYGRAARRRRARGGRGAATALASTTRYLRSRAATVCLALDLENMFTRICMFGVNKIIYNEAVSTEWAQLLRYMEARPLMRKAWRLVPVDLRRPITMFSMCVTYIIVIVQLSHFYD